MGVYKCPVCEGRGFVHNGFYQSIQNHYSTNTTATETCRTCGGKGIVFDSEVFQRNCYNGPQQSDPGYMTFVAKGTCSNCEHNDRIVYTSNPVKYKCTLDDKWHEADYRCEHWCEQQQKLIQGEPGTFQWMGVDLSTEPRTNKEDFDSYFRLNATRTEDNTVEGITIPTFLDGRNPCRDD